MPEPVTAIRMTLIVASNNYGKGATSETYWFPGMTPAAAPLQAAVLASLRAQMCGFLAGVVGVRMAQYTGTPQDQTLQRLLVMKPVDNGGLGWFTPLPGVDPHDPALNLYWSAYKSVGCKARLLWQDGSDSIITIAFPFITNTAPPIPGIGPYPQGDAAKFIVRANAYYGNLIALGAARPKILPYIKTDIIGGVNGDSNLNQPGGVFIQGNFVAQYPPNTLVKIGDRRNPRKGLQRPAADRGLGYRRVLNSQYFPTADPTIGAPANSTFISIVCSVNASGFGDPCVTPGWIAPLKRGWVPLSDREVNLLPRRVPTRAKRRL